MLIYGKVFLKFQKLVLISFMYQVMTMEKYFQIQLQLLQISQSMNQSQLLLLMDILDLESFMQLHLRFLKKLNQLKAIIITQKLNIMTMVVTIIFLQEYKFLMMKTFGLKTLLLVSNPQELIMIMNQSNSLLAFGIQQNKFKLVKILNTCFI